MARPEPALIALAAGRIPPDFDLTPGLVDSAIEHRMEGLLYSWAAEAGKLGDEGGIALSVVETRNWARNRMLASQAVKLEANAAEHGVEICFFKGVTLEAQVYGRTGERPSTDLDVMVRNGTVGDVAGWVASLQPRHMWIPRLEELIEGRHIQAIDLVVNGVQVDLHFDPLKLEIVRARSREDLLVRTVACEIDTGTVTALDAEANLVLALLHLNKDRFRRLIGYSDVRRLVGQVDDWDWLVRYVEAEGLTTPVLSTLGVVARTLDFPHPTALDIPPPRRMWELAWPERSRLLGRPGLVRYRYRQMLLPMFSSGRWAEGIAGALRRLFPPPPMLRAFYPTQRGPYLQVLLFGRVIRRVQRARQRNAVRDEDHAD
ncbi:MAG TPA: nucleotidyltransferase family protein [Acidimicrobiia bacterium]|nr:nucleotidyltransferase family protein [Acidimicrobiia bacterium]